MLYYNIKRFIGIKLLILKINKEIVFFLIVNTIFEIVVAYLFRQLMKIVKRK